MRFDQQLLGPNGPVLRSLEKCKSQIRRFRCAISDTEIFLFAAFPKSASQHLKTLLETAFSKDLNVATPKIAAGMGHNFLSHQKISKHVLRSRSLLLYGHIPYTEFNKGVVDQLKNEPKVLVTVRPLADIVVSYAEHVDRSSFGPLDYRIPGIKECFPSWPASTDETKRDYVIRFILPWFVRFIAGWTEASYRWPVQILTFEEHTRHPGQCIANLGDFLGLPYDRGFVDSLKKRKPTTTNFNVGIGGRGRRLLTDQQLHAVANLLELQSPALAASPLGKYLLYGYEGLPFDVEDVVQARPQQLVHAPLKQFRAA